MAGAYQDRGPDRLSLSDSTLNILVSERSTPYERKTGLGWLRICGKVRTVVETQQDFGNIRVMNGVICESVERKMSVEVLLLSG